MTVFDLLFLAVFFATVVALIAAAGLALRGKSTRAFRLLRNWGAGLAVYLAITLAANLLQPQRLLHLGEDLCSDDWCIAVTRSSVTPTPAGPLYNVEFRIRSLARRVDQRENGVTVQMSDDRGRHFDPLPDPAEVPFNTQLHAGESLSLTRRFQPPPGTGRVAVLIFHSGPGWLIIGEGNFHPPLVWLDGSVLRSNGQTASARHKSGKNKTGGTCCGARTLRAASTILSMRGMRPQESADAANTSVCATERLVSRVAYTLRPSGDFSYLNPGATAVSHTLKRRVD